VGGSIRDREVEYAPGRLEDLPAEVRIHDLEDALL
jgi:hypothetical protein